MMLVAALAVALQIVTGAAQDAQSPAAEIHGRVTDAQNGAPVAGSSLRLSAENSRTSFTARTDGDGRYRFTALPAGRYLGLVEDGGYRAKYIETPLRGPTGQRILLTSGQILRDVNVALERSRAVVVTVLDEWGGALTGIAVRVTDARTRQPVHVGYLQTTDDRGRVRLWGLARGSYVLCADVGPGLTFTSSRTKTAEQFLPTCYPSAATAEGGQPVKVDGDAPDVTIAMRRGRTFRISGSVRDATGAPAPHARLGFEHFRNGGTGTGLTLLPDARFVIENVVPGDYSLTATLAEPMGPQRRPPTESAYARFTVADSDVDDVVLAMARTAEVWGRVTLEDPSQPFVNPGAPLYIAPRLWTERSSELIDSAFMESEREFRMTGLFGKRILDVTNLPRGWYVKSILYHGKEIADVPTEFKNSPTRDALEIVLSTRGAVVAGRVLDDRGEPVAAAQIVMVSTDRSRWGQFDTLAGRSSPTGEYRAGPRRPGEYIVLALAGSAVLVDARDREQLAKMIDRGERITLGTIGEQVLDLRVISDR
jgi:protocatechuate 3,4-dioxygenase beta subunit